MNEKKAKKLNPDQKAKLLKIVSQYFYNFHSEIAEELTAEVIKWVEKQREKK